MGKTISVARLRHDATREGLEWPEVRALIHDCDMDTNTIKSMHVADLTQKLRGGTKSSTELAESSKPRPLLHPPTSKDDAKRAQTSWMAHLSEVYKKISAMTSLKKTGGEEKSKKQKEVEKLATALSGIVDLPDILNELPFGLAQVFLGAYNSVVHEALQLLGRGLRPQRFRRSKVIPRIIYLSSELN